MAGSFIPNTFDCSFENPSFFRSANYFNSSFTRSWATRLIPDVEGLNTPVYLQVLNKFNIPVDFSNGTPPGGTLPGIDIVRMSAIDAIRLSLAESLTQGQWWDVYEDVNGGVYFQRVLDNGGPGKTINLNIRSCIPSATIQNPIDMIVVRGYDPPPERFVRDFRDVVPVGTGEINPTIITGDERLFTISPADLTGDTTCHNLALNQRVQKSYKDPVTTDIDFRGQEPNPFYSVKEFEQLIGYVVDIDGLPEDPEEAARVKLSFSNSTTWYQEIEFPFFVAKSVPSCSEGLPVHPSIVYYEGIFEYTTPLFNDRYGTPWPLVLRPNGVFFTGHKLIEARVSPGIQASLLIEPIRGLIQLPEGSGWVYTRPGVLDYQISLFYQPHADPETWEQISLIGGDTPAKLFFSDGRPFSDDKLADGYAQKAIADVNILGSKDSLGHVIDKLWVAWDIDRPSVIIEDQEGEALQFAQNLRVRYAPIIIYDPPAPIVYKHRDAGEHIVDQTSGVQDNDPTTCQNFEESDLEIMENLKQGQVVDTTLPFCEDAEACLRVARTLFEYMNVEPIQTYTLTCGPDEEPELGAAVNGFDSNLRIDKISYSYQDGSSYTIEVSLSPIFTSIGSWNAGAWIRKTEDVSRPAVVRWTAGDGVNYLVEVKGLGTFYAVNTVADGNGLFYPGDIVTVTISNLPVEE